MERGGHGQGRDGRRARSGAGIVVAGMLLVTVACGETRQRPVPPMLDLAFDTTQIIRSPGLLTGTVNIVATGGLDFIQLTLSSDTGTILLDTLEGYVGETELARPVQWVITPGLPVGTTLHFRVLARDFVDFVTVDTMDFQTVP